jgi:hypothetical protein
MADEVDYPVLFGTTRALTGEVTNGVGQCAAVENLCTA